MKYIFGSILMILQLAAMSSHAQASDLSSLREQLKNKDIASVSGPDEAEFFLPGVCQQYNPQEILNTFVLGAKAAVVKTLASQGVQVASVQVSSRYRGLEAIDLGSMGSQEILGDLQMKITTADGTSLTGISIGGRVRSTLARKLKSNPDINNYYTEVGFNLSLKDDSESKYDNEGKLLSSQSECIVEGVNPYFVIYNNQTGIILSVTNDQSLYEGQVFKLSSFMGIY